MSDTEYKQLEEAKSESLLEDECPQEEIPTTVPELKPASLEDRAIIAPFLPAMEPVPLDTIYQCASRFDFGFLGGLWVCFKLLNILILLFSTPIYSGVSIVILMLCEIAVYFLMLYYLPRRLSLARTELTVTMLSGKQFRYPVHSMTSVSPAGKWSFAVRFLTSSRKNRVIIRTTTRPILVSPCNHEEFIRTVECLLPEYAPESV